MSHAARVVVINLSVTPGSTYIMPTNVEDGYPATAIRVIDSITAVLVDSGVGSNIITSIRTNNGTVPLLVFGKVFTANEVDTFTFTFPRGLPVYDTAVTTEVSGAVYSAVPSEPSTATSNKLTVTGPANVTTGSYLTLTYHWASRTQLG